jgi:glycosyltransferase involved in cell wall biosynthesis
MSRAPEKVRILRIIARMNTGGPAIQVTNLMKSLPETMFEQLLITGYCPQNEQDYLETHNIDVNFRKIKQLGRALNPVKDMLALYEIRKAIKEFKPDIIHTHTFKAGLIGRLAAKTVTNRTLLVHTFHGHLLNGYFGMLGTSVVIGIERVLARGTTRLISVGAKVKDDLLERGIGHPEQYVVINPGFKIDQPQELSRSEYGLSESDFVCGWFGRITKIKRADRVLEISKIAEFLTKKPVTFLIVGDGEDRNVLERQVNQSNLPIKFVGWQVDVASLMNLCDLVICTSENEGTPISLIEAQMLGRPVISTNVGSVQEVILPGKTGFALDYDPQKFWEKIEYLSNHPEELQKLSKQASTFALQQFSLARFISGHIDLYSKVLLVHPMSRP